MRDWGPHSYEKIELFSDYAKAFVKVTKKSRERVYLDAFAGETQNRLKDTGEVFPGSAELALSMKPPFTRVRLFELRKKRANALRELIKDAGPETDAQVFEGDCNIEIPRALHGLPTWAPTFAFLDPDGCEVNWATLVTLANHKRAWVEQLPSKRTKVEMWILFSTSGIIRMLGWDAKKSQEMGWVDQVGRLYGATGPWERIWEAKLAGDIDDAETRRCYAYLYMDRLASLGYHHLLARPVHNSKNELYVMILATDSDIGVEIMEHVQKKPRLLRKAQMSMFPETRPQYDRPWQEWRDDLNFTLPDWVELP